MGGKDLLSYSNNPNIPSNNNNNNISNRPMQSAFDNYYNMLVASPKSNGPAV